jgi:hypothetical protein
MVRPRGEASKEKEVERETGFEPATSTLAKRTSALPGIERTLRIGQQLVMAVSAAQQLYLETVTRCVISRIKAVST